VKKRFKSKKHKKYTITKIFIIIIFIYTATNLVYKLIYQRYLNTLSNKELINLIINNHKQSKNNILNKYITPKSIIENYFNIENLKTIEVDKEIKEPLVYIYNTHESESYKDKYLEAYNIKPTVKNMSYILKDYLEELKIPTIIETKSITKILKDNKWSYKYSYKASRSIIEPTIKNTSSLKLIIDLHRDSSNLNKTLLETNNKKYAKILFVVGAEYKNFEINYKLAETLNNLLELEVPGITRGITKKSGEGVNGIYNQDLSTSSVLIELGGQYNEIEELNNTLEILAITISKYIEETE
jgi:stage II sporulation protein P